MAQPWVKKPGVLLMGGTTSTSKDACRVQTNAIAEACCETIRERQNVGGGSSMSIYAAGAGSLDATRQADKRSGNAQRFLSRKKANASGKDSFTLTHGPCHRTQTSRRIADMTRASVRKQLETMHRVNALRDAVTSTGPRHRELLNQSCDSSRHTLRVQHVLQIANVLDSRENTGLT
eukprot:2476462-Amphidinium_carterae.1